MLGRALSLATVTLLIGCFAADPARAQAQNLEAGKSPSQIFAGTCTACHKSPRGLLKTVPAGSLQGFLKQHYTTSPDMASLLASFLVSNGATDSRYVGIRASPARMKRKNRKPSPAARASNWTALATGCALRRRRRLPGPRPSRRARLPSQAPIVLSPDVMAAAPGGWRGRANRRPWRGKLRIRQPASAAPMAANFRPSRS